MANPDSVVTIDEQRSDAVHPLCRLNGHMRRAPVTGTSHQSPRGAHPQAALVILRERPDLHGAIGTRRQIQLHAAECRPIGRPLEGKQSSVRAGPQASLTVLVQDVDPIGLRIVADGESHEPGSAGRVVTVAATFCTLRGPALDRRGETVHAAAVGRHPVRPEGRLEKTVDAGVVQAVRNAVGGEPLAIEAAQPLWPAEPEESAGIDNDARDAKVGEAVGGRVGFDRQPLGRRGAGQREDKSESDEDPSHRANLDSRVECIAFDWCCSGF